MWHFIGILFFISLPFLILIVLVYLFLGVFIHARFKIVAIPEQLDYPKQLSVIIPFRNESTNLLNCIQSLKAQEGVDLELIFVDDHSDDIGPEIIQAHSDGLNVVLLQANGQGKKAALLKGIAAASHPIVWTTDADCVVNPGTLKSMLIQFHHQKLNMLCGLVQLKGSSIFQQLQQAESAALVGISAVLLNEERPATCNGASLMFKTSVFEKLGGYGGDVNSSSGDDDLLMQRFAEWDISKVRYHLVPGTSVETNAEKTFTSFIAQRARWASKHSKYRFPYNSLLLFLMVSKILLFFYFLALGILFEITWFYIPTLVLLIADGLMAYKFSKIIRFNAWLIPFMPFYQLYVPIAWLLSKTKRVLWKERTVERQS